MYVGMVWVLSLIIAILSPPTTSPESFLSETPRRGKESQRGGWGKEEVLHREARLEPCAGGGPGEGHRLLLALSPPPRQACTMYTLGFALRARQFLLFRTLKRFSSFTIFPSSPLRSPSWPCAMSTTKAQLMKSSRASMSRWNLSSSSWNCCSKGNSESQEGS